MLLRPALLRINCFHRRYDAFRFLRRRFAQFSRVIKRLLSRPTNIRAQLWPLQVLRRLDRYVSDSTAGALQNSFRFVERSPIIKSQVYMVRIDGYMKDAIAQTIAGAVTDRHGAISVIDIFVAR